jgi:transcriptional regulator with XRE-family HTH domain
MHPLKKARMDLGYSQRLLADFIGISVPTIKRIEAGKAARVDNIRLICDFFTEKYNREVKPRELGLISEEIKENIEPTYIPQTSNDANTFTLNAEITDRLDNAENIINLAWEAWFASRPREVVRSINRLLPNLEKIAYSPYPPGYTSHAKHLAIRAHGLLGTIYSDALQNDSALFHYMQAHRFAEEIHDIDLTSTYLCLIGDALRQQNDPSKALRHMETARDLAAHASNATRGHILQLLAYAYGDTGQEAAFEKTITEATDLLAFTGEGRDRSQKEFIPFEIYEIRGKVNRDLGKPLDALPYLELAEKSLSTADSITPRWHALLEISRAQTYCDAGDIITGIDLACKGFTMARQCHSPHQMNRVRKLLRKLERGSFQNHPKVQYLKNLVYETYMNMDHGIIETL